MVRKTSDIRSRHAYHARITGETKEKIYEHILNLLTLQTKQKKAERSAWMCVISVPSVKENNMMSMNEIKMEDMSKCLCLVKQK